MATKSTYKILKADQSTTLNEIYPSQSFHRDETIVVGKIVSSSLISGGPYRKRALLKFSKYSEETGYSKAYLQVYEAQANALQKGQIIEIGFQTASLTTGNEFIVGRGRRDSNPPVKEGSTWQYSNVSTDTEWQEQTASAQAKTDYIVTASADIDIDVSALLSVVNSNNTFRFVHLNYKSTHEDDAVIRGEIEYYSSETHTVYQPTLVVASESISACAEGKEDGDFTLDNDFVLYHKNLRDTYQANSKLTFKFGARTLYPSATYGTSSSTIGLNYIPSESTYNFKDLRTGELILPTSMQDNLAIESNATCHYIENVPSDLFYPYRKYQLVVNVISGSTTETVVLPETFQVEAS